MEVASVEERQGWRVEVGERQGWRWLHLEKVKVGGGFSWGRSRLEVASPKKVKIGGGFIWGRLRLEVASLGKVKIGGGFG